ncbi:MAG TPA: hypothetical protein VFI15_10540 [Candidatus Limnocylindrales bacterium]|nr:hypothetical protein [Candidatus Limnocylindrales bacterium]
MVRRAPESFIAILVAALSLGAPAANGVRAADATPPPGTALADESDAGMHFRLTFGLRADPDYVALAAKGGPDFSNADWGVPLSDAEAAEMQRRLDIQHSLTAALEYANSQPSFAGAYIDQLQQGMPVFLFTDPDAIDASKLSAGVDASTKVAIGRAAYTLKELTSTQELISDSREQLTRAGLDVTSVSTNVETNQVEVAVAKMTTEGANALRNIAPAAVLMEGGQPVADACTITSCPPPTGLIGGLYIIESGIHYCTAGWVGKRLDVSGVTALVTAGHCVRGGSLDWHHNSSVIGYAANSNGWYDGSWSDVGWIVLNSSSIPSAKNKALYNPTTSPPKVVSITSTADANQQLQGEQVCRIGYGSWYKETHPSDPLHNHYTGLQCGKIVRYSSDSNGVDDEDSQSCVATTNCKYIRYMKVVGFDSTGGDSGGTIFEPTTGSTAVLLGTHVHSETDSSSSDRGWYTTYQYNHIELHDYLGYDIVACLTASC